MEMCSLWADKSQKEKRKGKNWFKNPQLLLNLILLQLAIDQGFS